MGLVADFFCEEVAAVDNTRDVKYRGLLVVDGFADHVFAEIEMFDAFGGSGPGLVHTRLVVIVNWDVEVSVRHVEILSLVFDTE